MKNGKYLAIIGAVLQVGPIIGIIGALSIFSMTVGTEGWETGEAASDVVVAALNMGTLILGFGIVVGCIGLIPLYVSVFYSKYRSKALFWFLMFFLPWGFASPPFGTIAGVHMFVYALMNRGEFLKDKPLFEKTKEKSLSAKGRLGRTRLSR